MASCEDMLDPKSDLVMYVEDNQLNTVHDTLYSAVGVLLQMQKVMDKTFLLGEVRGDLVSVTDAATSDLKALASFDADTLNSYNRPEDYYAVINNCNYFIATADSGFVKQGRSVFARELAAVRSFRAWAYLQLALNYREVPFYTHFLGTQAEANAVMRQPKKGLDEICSLLIEDLRPWANTLPLEVPASYYIPARLMLGELCLWSGRYQEAAQYYHDFLTDNDNPRPIGVSRYIRWSTTDLPPQGYTDSYSTLFSSGDLSDYVCTIPLENTAFYGTITDLPEIYTSTEDNNGFFQLTYSTGLLELSEAQSYYYVYTQNNRRDTVSMKTDSILVTITDRKRVGDLRLAGVVRESASNNRGSSKYNSVNMINRKFSANALPLYRTAVVYLHYAEALNRAGFPTAAFAILKYGLSMQTLQRVNGNPIDPRERAKAGTLLTFNQYTFTSQNTCGVHSRGSGDVEANPEYVMPQPAEALATYADTVAYQQLRIEDLILEELALEACFEGQRFYDLMRVALRRNDPAYLADRVALRNGADQPDEALRARLMQPSAWYLPLRR